jgi:hypothetical protein
MATIRQSRRVNMDGWKPAAASTPQSPPPDDDNQRTGRSPFMLSSMPFDATNNDGIQRQFYGGANAPTTRILTPTGGTP